MGYKRKIVLHCPNGSNARLSALVEAFITDGVRFVGVVGLGCAEVEDEIDWLIVGDGSNDARFILTASHPNESVAEAIEFAGLFAGEYGDGCEVVEL